MKLFKDVPFLCAITKTVNAAKEWVTPEPEETQEEKEQTFQAKQQIDDEAHLNFLESQKGVPFSEEELTSSLPDFSSIDNQKAQNKKALFDPAKELERQLSQEVGADFNTELKTTIENEHASGGTLDDSGFAVKGAPEPLFDEVGEIVDCEGPTIKDIKGAEIKILSEMPNTGQLSRGTGNTTHEKTMADRFNSHQFKALSEKTPKPLTPKTGGKRDTRKFTIDNYDVANAIWDKMLQQNMNNKHVYSWINFSQYDLHTAFNAATGMYKSRSTIARLVARHGSKTKIKRSDCLPADEGEQRKLFDTRHAEVTGMVHQFKDINQLDIKTV